MPGRIPSLVVTKSNKILSALKKTWTVNPLKLLYKLNVPISTLFYSKGKKEKNKKYILSFEHLYIPIINYVCEKIRWLINSEIQNASGVCASKQGRKRWTEEGEILDYVNAILCMLSLKD